MLYVIETWQTFFTAPFSIQYQNGQVSVIIYLKKCIYGSHLSDSGIDGKAGLS